ncbi:MAG: phospholipid carrier-dependent glycosyltransferase, partial [Brevibacterium sp.]
MSQPEDPQAPRRSTDPAHTSADPAHTPTSPAQTAAAPTQKTSAPTTSAPGRRLARERLATKRETVRVHAAAMRRRTFAAGMWATRAPLWMWPALLIITAIGGGLRLFRLDFPHRMIFDETYYVKDGYSVFTFGYERAWPEDADDSFNAGDPSVIEPDPEYDVHPPLGKWIIGAGN